MAKGTPSRCPDCGCVAWHCLKSGTQINTPQEAYVCATGCGCERLADEMPVPAGFKRVDHAWDYA